LVELRALRRATVAIAFVGGSTLGAALAARLGAPEDTLIVLVQAAAFLVAFAALIPIGWGAQLALGAVTVAAAIASILRAGTPFASVWGGLLALAVAAIGAAAIAWLGDRWELRWQEEQDRLPRSADDRPTSQPWADDRIADLSHDLRNPLAVALGYSEMAGDEELPDEERAGALARVKRSLWELTQMVENVLERSADEAG